MSASINTLVTELSTTLVVLQEAAFRKTYLTDDGTEERTIAVHGVLVPLSVIVPHRSLYVDQVNVEYSTTAETKPLDPASGGMKITIQYKSTVTDVF